MEAGAMPGSPVQIRPGPRGARHLRELVAHLALRDLAAMHRFTLLGWTWPLARQLAQFAVLLVVFGTVLDLGIPDYPAFVFSGLLVWAWFAAGVQRASTAVIAGRHLLFHPRFPALALPAVAVTVPLIDFAIALPVMAGIVVFSGELHATVLLLPLLVAIQLTLMAGLGWIAAALAVYVRDVGQVVAVGLLLLFYLTPVFYDHTRVPDYRWLFDLNPLTALLTAYRDVLLRGDLPDPGAVAALAAGGALVAAAGYAFFKRLEPGFVDEL
jgi:lipopolysaccharide transport system permease protein